MTIFMKYITNACNTQLSGYYWYTYLQSLYLRLKLVIHTNMHYVKWHLITFGRKQIIKQLFFTNTLYFKIFQMKSTFNMVH